jgi:hypothetical protein
MYRVMEMLAKYWTAFLKYLKKYFSLELEMKFTIINSSSRSEVMSMSSS